MLILVRVWVSLRWPIWFDVYTDGYIGDIQYPAHIKSHNKWIMTLMNWLELQKFCLLIKSEIPFKRKKQRHKGTVRGYNNNTGSDRQQGVYIHDSHAARIYRNEKNKRKKPLLVQQIDNSTRR